MRHGWVHMLIAHRPTLTLQLHNFDLFRTVPVVSALLRGNWQDFNWQRIARSLGDSWASWLYQFRLVVKVDRRIRWHYTTTILRLRIGARLTRYRNCKFHNFARTISRHADTADGISRYSVPPSAGPHLPLVPSVCPSGSLSRAFVESILKQTLCDSLEIITALSVKFRYTPENHNRPQTTAGEWRPQETIRELA